MAGSGNGRRGPRVLVIGRSPVNFVVVSRIVERTGLTARCEPPEAGARALADEEPAIVILDGGPDDGDCDALIEPLRAARQANGSVLPAIILLSTAIAEAARKPAAGICDMILAKPITVDRLQPAIEAMRARNGEMGGTS